MTCSHKTAQEKSIFIYLLKTTYLDTIFIKFFFTFCQTYLLFLNVLLFYAFFYTQKAQQRKFGNCSRCDNKKLLAHTGVAQKKFTLWDFLQFLTFFKNMESRG